MYRQKGVTLIALVITIIILLILAGISIATLTGENGILNKASKASEEIKRATAEEKIKLAIGEYEVKQRMETLYSCLEKIEGLQSINPSDPNKVPPCYVIVDDYEFEITANLELNYIQKVEGILPEIEEFEKIVVTESVVTLKIKASTKDEKGLQTLIIKNGDTLIEQKDINGKQIEEEIEVNVNGNYSIIIIGQNGRRVTSKTIEVTEISTINGKITAGTVIDGNVVLVTVAETQVDRIEKVEIYSNENKITQKEYQDKQIECEIELENLIFYEDTICYARITDSSGKSFKTNEVIVKNVDTIANETDLRNFAKVVNEGEDFDNSKEIKQKNDIVLSQNHIAIGTEQNPFKGRYKGKKVDGIQINNNEKNQGFFGYIEKADLQDIVLGIGSIQGECNVGGICGNSNNSNIIGCSNENTTIVAKGYITKTYTWNNNESAYPYSNVGGIVGYGYNSNVDFCDNQGTINGYYSAIGGIVGFDDGDTTRIIKNCNNMASFSVTLQDNSAYGIGGITGESYQQGKIQNCNNTGNIISNKDYTGGIIGVLTCGIIENCNNRGKVQARAIVGGIAGQSTVSSQINQCMNEETINAMGFAEISGHYQGTDSRWNASVVGGIVGLNAGEIISCKNKGNVKANSYQETGGIAGFSNNSLIKKCANYSDIENQQQWCVGGIVGYTIGCTIEECFNVGNIKATEAVGGISGATTYTTIKNCYNISSISGDTAIGGIVGRVFPYELTEGYEFIYNCYNIGNITGAKTNTVDNWVGISYYLGYDHIYTTKSLYDAIGNGTWENGFGNRNWEAIEGTEEQIKSKMLMNLLKGNGEGKWTRDTTAIKNNGYPYLMDNFD